jgi:hypothetical protein
MKISQLVVAVGIATIGASAWAKLPPAPQPDPAAATAKAEKDKAAAEKTKVLQAASEDKAVKNFQANMRKTGKPIPKPTPVVVAAAPAPAPVTAAPSGKVAAPAGNAKDAKSAGK